MSKFSIRIGKSNLFILSCFALASFIIVSSISITPASALISGACNCVVFRLDDIQDYYLSAPQIAVLDDFKTKNENVTLGVIMNFIGNDQTIVSKVIQGRNNPYEIVVHGWNHDDYSLLSAQTQKDTLQLAKNKMATTFGVNATIFIMPYNTYDLNTLQAMEDLGFNVISSEFSQEDVIGTPHIYVDDGTNLKDSFGIYHLPQVVENYNVTGAIPIKTPESTIMANVTSAINEYGYAVITMHPSDFSERPGGVANGVVNATEIASLDSLIAAIHTAGFSIKSMNHVVHLSPLGIVDNTPPSLTVPTNVAVVSAQASTIVSVGTATATDILDPSPIITNNATTQISTGFPQGRTAINWTATDHSGNHVSKIQYVTIGNLADTTPPTITLTAPSSNSTIQGTSLGYNLRINGTAADAPAPTTFGVAKVVVNTDQTADADATPISTGNWSKWTYVLHLEPGNPPSPVTAIDAYSFDFWNNQGFLPNPPGVISGLNIILTGADTTKPELRAPADINVTATGPLTPVSLGTPIVYDNSDLNPTVSNSIGPGESSGFPPGTTNVTWSAKDASNNVATQIQKITIFDLTPSITSVTPATGSFINSAFLANYTLSEVVGSGNFTFTNTGGTADGSAHFYNFTTNDKSIGIHSVNSTERTTGGFGSLVEGAIYTMKVSAKDAVTLVSTSVSNTSITYDITAPSITLVTPASSSSINSGFSANYTLGETVPVGTIAFTRTGGTADSTTHLYTLNSTERASGPHSISRGILEASFGHLVSASIYNMTVSATDAATNKATVTNTSLTYDDTAPNITSVTPTNSTVNSGFSVGYTTDKDLSSGTITFTRTGGATDSFSPHVYNFATGDKTTGVHSISRTTLETGFGNPLVSGASYTMTVNAIDLALNSATPVSYAIIYDSTAPSITLVTPATGARVNNLFTANYTLGETIDSGSIEFKRTGGTADGSSPHIYLFSGSGYKTSGQHSVAKTDLEILFGSSLVNGAIYNMTVTATDAVSNTANVTNTSITLDTTAPVISSVLPATSSPINQFNAVYTLNEAALSGTITFTRTGGTADGLSHVYNFATDDKTAGSHSISKSTLQAGFGNSLVSGAIYTMTISASDLASNAATPVAKTSLTYTNPQPTCAAPTNPWIITSGCSISSTVVAPGNVEIQNGAVVTINSGGILDIDSVTKYLKIKFGSGILVKSGGKIK